MALPIQSTKTRAVLLTVQGSDGSLRKATLHYPTALIGRGSHCDIPLKSSTISRNHCVICHDGVQFVISDLASRTGVQVNDQMVLEIEIEQGMDVRIGRFQFGIEMQEDPVPELLSRVSYSEPVDAKLTDTITEEEFELTKVATLVGSHPHADVRLEDEEVGVAHALLVRHVNGVILRDLGIQTGVLVNGEPVTLCMLDSGDEVTIGPFSLFLESSGTPSEQEPRPDDAPPPEME